jgi:hypothetical protein
MSRWTHDEPVKKQMARYDLPLSLYLIITSHFSLIGEKRTYLGYTWHYKEYKTCDEESNPNGQDKIAHKTHMIKEQIKDGYMNRQDKVKHMSHRIK